MQRLGLGLEPGLLEGVIGFGPSPSGGGIELEASADLVELEDGSGYILLE